MMASGERTAVGEWWEDVAPMMRNAVPRSIEVEVGVPEGLARLAVPRHRLTQAVINLIQNAGDAIRARGGSGGRITVSAAAGEVDGGGRVRLSVADNGCGMSEEVRRRCLEPFFTTKARGVSTGLGLALVAGIVEQSRGTIEVWSREGEGSTFTLVLPAAPPAGADRRDGRDATRAVVTVADPRMRGLIVTILRELGAVVALAPTGTDPSGEEGLDVEVWATDTSAEAAARFVEGSPARRVVLLGEGGGEPSSRVRALGQLPRPGALRDALRASMEEAQRGLLAQP
jgi:hypothetical protein